MTCTRSFIDKLAASCFSEPFCSRPVCFYFRHFWYPFLKSDSYLKKQVAWTIKSSSSAPPLKTRIRVRCTCIYVCRRRFRVFPMRQNHLGDRIIVMVRPSNFGCCSTTANSLVSSAIFVSSSFPAPERVISRPLKITVILTLSFFQEIF